MDPPTGVIRKEVRKGLEPQSQTQIIFTGPFEYTPENRLGMRLLTGALQIRLRELVREELGGTYTVNVNGSYERYPEESYGIGINFGSDPERVEELVTAVMEELEAFRAQGPTVEEFQAVTEQERRTRETSMEENGWWVTQLRFAYQNGSDPTFLLDENLLEGMTPEKLRTDAQQYLRMDNYVQVSLFPEGGLP
jgi:zinc protease